MTNKTYRFAAVAAVLLALLVFAAPVSAAEDGATEMVEGHVASLDNGTTTYYTSIKNATNAAQNGDTVTIFSGTHTEDISVNKAITVIGETDVDGNLAVFIKGKVSINAMDATIKNLNVQNSGNAGVINNGANVLIENCKFVGSNGFRYCYATGLVTFKNTIITGDTYGIHFDGSAGGKIVIENCEITGWTSFAGTIEKVTISNSKFLTGNYNVLRFYQNAEVTNTVFPAGMRIDTGNGGVGMEGIEVKFNGCSMEDNSNFEEVFPDSVIEKSDVYVEDVILGRIAQIGTTYYTTIEGALEDATKEATVLLLDNVDGEVIVSKSLTIDGNGKTITGMINLANADERIAVVLKDLTINNPSSYAVKVATEADVTIADSTLTGYNAVYVVNAS
ncbi:hypothetical protein J6A32_10425, partial [Methanocorpusculum sp.]|nr:hypothetical protein [Methanocorpusculum sp.]